MTQTNEKIIADLVAAGERFQNAQDYYKALINRGGYITSRVQQSACVDMYSTKEDFEVKAANAREAIKALVEENEILKKATDNLKIIALKASAGFYNKTKSIEFAREGLEKLSKLGAEPHLGNSDGNVLAQKTLAKINKLTGGTNGK